MKKSTPLFLLTMVSLVGVDVRADEWGSLAGRIVYDGQPPEVRTFDADKDVECCGMQSDGSLLVDGKTRGIKNVVIWLHSEKKGEGQPAIHPERFELANKKVLIDIKRCRFEPHVAVARVGETLTIRNHDPLGHVARAYSRDERNGFAPILRADADVDHVFSMAESIPVHIHCNIHPWMSSFVVVKDHPYVAISGEDGRFEIKDLPAGKWTFRFWHERDGYIQQVERNGQKARWNKGLVEVVIPPDETLDLGEIEVAPEEFERK
jgi:plastocyanin